MLDDLKESMKSGLRELRDRADDLALQGRIRMDVFQTERRMKHSFAILGAAVYQTLSEGVSVSPDDPKTSELVARVKYYEGELDRLRAQYASTAP